MFYLAKHSSRELEIKIIIFKKRLLRNQKKVGAWHLQDEQSPLEPIVVVIHWDLHSDLQFPENFCIHYLMRLFSQPDIWGEGWLPSISLSVGVAGTAVSTGTQGWSITPGVLKCSRRCRSMDTCTCPSSAMSHALQWGTRGLTWPQQTEEIGSWAGSRSLPSRGRGKVILGRV